MASVGALSPPSSPLSSLASNSPSPPPEYLSPPSSNASDAGTSAQLRRAHADSPSLDGPPPAKKQRIMKPKELKTEYLDLCALSDSSDAAEHKLHDAKLKKLVDILRSKRKIVVIAGAGISVSAGIPDFRSSTGLFNTLRSQHKLKASGKHLFDASVYRSDSSTSSFHDMVRELSHLTQNAKPTPFHHMLATLAEEGRLLRLYTQNVDGIDTALEPLATTVPLNKKGPWPKTIQLHGGLTKMVCSKCGHLSDFNGALFDGPEPPSCTECEVTDGVRVAGGLRSHGIGRLRPRMVLYNEFNPDEEAIGAVSHADLKSRPDAVIVVGTSLKVPGIRRLVKEMCAVTRDRRGGCTAWINYDPEPLGLEFKDSWDLVVRGECDDVARHVGLPQWNDKDYGDYRLVPKSEPKVKTGIEVVVIPKALEVVKQEGFPTPDASPRQRSPPPTNGVAKSTQSTLPFGSKKPVGQPAKAKKKTGRKALPDVPVERITGAFRPTKTAMPSTKKSANIKSEGTRDDVKSSLQSKMLGIHPPSSQDYRQGLSKEDDTANSDYPPNPTTPVRGQRSPTWTETISPKGTLPHNMERLLS